MSLNFHAYQKIFDDNLKNQARFLCNCMNLFESSLLFIRATHQQIWELHLGSLHNLSKYFFAFDMLNYARLTPVYLAQMYALQESDIESGNFCKMETFLQIKQKLRFQL